MEFAPCFIFCLTHFRTKSEKLLHLVRPVSAKFNKMLILTNSNKMWVYSGVCNRCYKICDLNINCRFRHTLVTLATGCVGEF